MRFHPGAAFAVLTAASSLGTSAFSPVRPSPPRPFRTAAPSDAAKRFALSSDVAESTVDANAAGAAVAKSPDVVESAAAADFDNDGPFAWMGPYLTLFGFTEGKTLVGAIPMLDVTSTSAELSPSDVEERRRSAREEMVNIGPEERRRRIEIGEVGLKIAFAYAVFVSVFLDDGFAGGHLVKMSILVPFFFGYAFRASGRDGL